MNVPSTPGSAGRDDPLNELVARALGAFEEGGEAAVEALCREHPEHAGSLQRRLSLLRNVGVLTGAPERTPERLGEFRLVRMLGAGGMGVVYLAVQESLAREVALKIVRPEHLYFPGARERFRREVETVARLQHPGIVPVYTVGEESGVPFFAMEYVRGKTLEEIVAGLRGKRAEELAGTDLAPAVEARSYLFEGTWEEACLRVVRQAAEALEHAHQRGVVHRDIKPSNVILAADGTSRAMLLDFGLASMQGGGKLTRTGSQLGSLYYMAPEQTRGAAEDLGPRSDVYALGVTLYELLTLRRPFESGSDVEVILKIQAGRAARPRDVNPSLSWEAETVCLTAMDVDPARRYASAADFARDLGNVLDRRPIEAQRAGTFLRLRRWTERHPGSAAAVALGALLVIGGPTLYAWQQHRASLSIAEQRDRAEKNFERALEAVDRMLSKVGDIDLRFVPQMEPVRRAVLEDAVELLQGFVADESSNERARREIARARRRLALLLGDLGRNQEASDVFALSTADLEALAGASPSDVALQEEAERTRLDHATTLINSGRTSHAREVLERSRERIDALAIAQPDSREVQLLAAERLHALAGLEAAVGDYAEARTTFELAIEHFDRLAARWPDHLRTLESHMETCNEYGLLLLQRFTPEDEGSADSVHALQRTVDLAEDLRRAAPDDPSHRSRLATAELNLAGAWRRSKEYDTARDLLESSREGMESLVREFPENLNYKLELATAVNQIGLLVDIQGKDDEMEPYYRRTVELLREVVDRAPLEPTLLNRLGIAEYNLGAPVRLRGDLTETEALLASAVAHQRKALELAPQQTSYSESLYNALAAQEWIRRLRGDHRGCAELAQELPSILPRSFESHRRAAYALTQCMQIASDDPGLADSQRAEVVAQYSMRATEHLRTGMSLGPMLKKPLREFVDFKPLHGISAFDQLLAEIESKQP